MRVNIVLKGLFTGLMTAALVVGIFHVSAQPAAALQCPEVLLGNDFSHVEQSQEPPECSWNICCCIYVTPTGQFVEGPSWYC